MYRCETPDTVSSRCSSFASKDTAMVTSSGVVFLYKAHHVNADLKSLCRVGFSRIRSVLFCRIRTYVGRRLITCTIRMGTRNDSFTSIVLIVYVVYYIVSLSRSLFLLSSRATKRPSLCIGETRRD